MTAGTVTAVLSCGHLKDVPASTELPDVAGCPRTGCEISALLDGGPR